MKKEEEVGICKCKGNFRAIYTFLKVVCTLPIVNPGGCAVDTLGCTHIVNLEFLI